MIDYYTIPDDEIPMSMRYFRKALKEQGWKAEKFCRECLNNLVLTRPDGKKLRVASSIPPTTNTFAQFLADNKLMSHELLKSVGAKQPETIPVKTAQDAEALVAKYGKIVIKPVDGAHGHGVTVGISSAEEIEEAIKRAEQNSPLMGLAIAQPQLPPDELEMRVICVDYKFVVAIARIPARVTGDGKHNLRELIEIENKTIRTVAYQSDLGYIDLEMAEKYLGERVWEVPQAGKQVRVVASCNLGQGGTVEDRSAEISDEQKRLAEEIARAAELPMIGIDYYGDQIIEINAAPSMYYPTGNEAATKTVMAFIEYLSKL